MWWEVFVFRWSVWSDWDSSNVVIGFPNFRCKALIFIAITRSSIRFEGIFEKHCHVSVHKISSLEGIHVEIVHFDAFCIFADDQRIHDPLHSSIEPVNVSLKTAQFCCNLTRSSIHSVSLKGSAKWISASFKLEPVCLSKIGTSK